MPKLPFIVTHEGVSVQCDLMVNKAMTVRHIEVRPAADQSHLPVYRQICERVEDLNDLIAAEVPWEALASCRRSPGLNAAIIDAAATELDNLRGALAENGDAV